MTAAISGSGVAIPAPLVLQPRRWTCAEFHHMGDMGWFEGRRAMLIDGEILEMPGPNPPHATVTTKVDYTLRQFFGEGYVIRNQAPLVLGQTTDPEPDLAVVRGRVMDYYDSHPTTAELVIEVADSTLAYDSTQKANLYASARINDYWVVDIPEKRLLVFRNPKADAGLPFGAHFASPSILTPPAVISPLCAPHVEINVAELLP